MDFTKLQQLDPSTMPGPIVHPDQVLTAIVKVRDENYHPQRLVVRKQIDKWMFTAEFLAKDLAGLEADTLVETISVANALPSY
jgi:hypothetical protein